MKNKTINISTKCHSKFATSSLIYCLILKLILLFLQLLMALFQANHYDMFHIYLKDIRKIEFGKKCS